MTNLNNIYPVFDQLLQRSDKENALKQKAKVLWLTGLSGSGKTTVARQIESVLHQKGFITKVLDGDNVRTGICNNLSFTAEDRMENIRRIAEVSRLFLDGGIVVINSFVSPTIEIREAAKAIIGEADFIEVFVNASLEVCEKRDVKGLYKKARAGEIKNFTGIDAPFEAPPSPQVEVNTGTQSVAESAGAILDYALPLISMEK